MRGSFQHAIGMNLLIRKKLREEGEKKKCVVEELPKSIIICSERGRKKRGVDLGVNTKNRAPLEEKKERKKGEAFCKQDKGTRTHCAKWEANYPVEKKSTVKLVQNQETKPNHFHFPFHVDSPFPTRLPDSTLTRPGSSSNFYSWRITLPTLPQTISLNKFSASRPSLPETRALLLPMLDSPVLLLRLR